MDINKSGGPAFPTLTGRMVNENEFRFEGMTLFDYYLAAILSSGLEAEEAVEEAMYALELRNEYLTEIPDDTEED
jgi:hypothetical protein